MTYIVKFDDLVWFDSNIVITLNSNKYSAQIIGSTINDNTITFICETRNEKLPVLFSYILDTDTFEFDNQAVYYQNNTIQSLKHPKTLVSYNDYLILFTCKYIIYWNKDNMINDEISNTNCLNYNKLMSNIITSINNELPECKHLKYVSINGISIDESSNTIYIGIGTLKKCKCSCSESTVIIVKSKISIEDESIVIDENFKIIDYTNLIEQAELLGLSTQSLTDLHFDKDNSALYVLTYGGGKGYLWKYIYYNNINMFQNTPTLVKSTCKNDTLIFNQIPSSMTKIKDNHYLITLNHKGCSLNVNNFDYVVIQI